MTAQKRTERIEARTTPDILALVRQAAELQGRSVSDFVTSAAEEIAKRTIEDTQIVRLSAEDQKRFVQALLDPPEPTLAMKRAFENRKKLFGES